jgi:SsrA-binding protein
MRVINRVFTREFEEMDKYEAGIALTGGEVKSALNGGIKLEHSFVKILDGEAYLFNAEFAPYQFTGKTEYDPVRKRKLLLHKKELIKLQTKIQSGGRLTIVPIACYTKGRRIKVEIALVKARGEIGQKRLEKARDVKIDQKREIKEYLKT